MGCTTPSVRGSGSLTSCSLLIIAASTPIDRCGAWLTFRRGDANRSHAPKGKDQHRLSRRVEYRRRYPRWSDCGYVLRFIYSTLLVPVRRPKPFHQQRSMARRGTYNQAQSRPSPPTPSGPSRPPSPPAPSPSTSTLAPLLPKVMPVPRPRRSSHQQWKRQGRSSSEMG